MSQINTNVSSMIAQRVLGNNNNNLTTTLERLSTGLRINRGKDDPAGLIASENLRSEQRAISAAISNAQRAEQVVNVAEGGLQEINALLLELQSLVGESANDAGLSIEEKEANQLQIDSILQTIDRVSNATSFQGSKLLNGNFDYTTSGVDDAELSNVKINSAKLSNAEGAQIDVTVNVLTSAQTAGVYMSTGGALDGQGSSVTIEVTGSEGVQQFTFASGSTQTQMVNAINTFTDAMGVSAAVDGDRIELRSTQFGGEEFVNVKVLEADDAFDSDFLFLSSDDGAEVGSSQLKDFGRNATVLINGNQATTDGLVARVATDGFDVEVAIDGTSTLNVDGASSEFSITGGGADFSLSPKVNLAGKASLGIQSTTSGNLGSTIDGFLSALKSGGEANVTNGDLTKAQKVVDASIKQISGLRGRLGAFQKNTIGATINNLGVTLENTAAAESAIRDTDFAAETANLTRQQIMQQAATQSLSIANAQPQSVLALLG